MSEDFVDGVFSFFALACLVGLFYTGWQSLVIDVVRQRMFEIRDRTFLWAFDNGRLDDPEYRQFRDVANMTIRHYEHTSVVKLFVLSWIFGLGRKASKSRRAPLRDRHLRQEHEEIIRVAVRGLVLRSLVILIPTALMLPVTAIQSLLNGRSLVSRRVVRTLSREIDAEIGLLEAA